MDNPGLLSQSEIDALLAAISAPQESSDPAPSTELVSRPPAAVTAPAPSAVAYDFRRPDRFSKEQMRALRMIHEAWARRVSVSLSAYLRTSVEVALADIDQGTYTTLSQQLPDQGVYYIIGLLPLPGHFMLHMTLELAMMIVDRLMGGPGTASKTERRLTELETELLRGTTERLLSDLQESWANVAVIRPRVDDLSLNLLLVPIALPADAIVWASFEVRAKGYASGMTLGLPYPVLKPVAGQLSPYTWANSFETQPGGESSKHRQDLEEQLSGVKLPVSVLLGSVDLDLVDLANLQPGDVVPLDMPVDGLCPVQIAGHVRFLGRAGLVRRKLAVQLVDTPPEALAVVKGRPNQGQEQR